MTDVFTELQDFLLARRTEMLAELAQNEQRQSAGYARLAQEELLPTMNMTIEALAEAIGNQDLLPFIAHAEALGEMRAYEGFMLTDVLVAVNIFRNLTWDALEDFAARQPACTIEIARIVEDMIGQFKRAMVTSFNQTYNQLHDQLRDQAEQIERSSKPSAS